MQIEIISNINMDSLKFYLKDYNVKNSCSYGNYLIDLLDENSKLYSDETDCVVCFLDVDTLTETLDMVFEALLKLKEKNKTVILNTFCFYPFYMDTFTNESLKKELEYNRKVIEFTKENHFLLLDFSSIIKRLGSENIYSDKYWYMGKIKYTTKAFEEIALNIKELLKANKESCKKCLVLDLDNTLWGGVIGEGEIELSNEGKGAIYQDFQKKIKRLKDFGILLAINSKNNYDDAILGLNHKSSILKEEDFIIIKSNWDNKNQNISAIAKELNIGEDSLVFIDDNPVERELVKNTTEACIPAFPSDIYELNSWFIKEVIYKYFYKLEINSEDSNKQNQYEAKIKRDKVSKSMSYEEFLKSLKINISFYINDEKNIQRYAQLTQKTNQFNLTTKRYSIQDIKNFIKDDNYLVVGIDYEDKYAKEGIIGLAIVKIAQEAYIDTLLLSCRVLKREVEKKLINKIIEQLPDSKKLIGEYLKTPKNVLVENLYESLGFVKIDETKYAKEI